MRVTSLLALWVLSGMAALAQPVFVDVTAEIFPDGLANGHYVWGDCNGDGFDDLLVGASTIYLSEGPPHWRMPRHTATGALSSGAHARGIFVDIDNDGDLDIFGIGQGMSEELFENDGACSFVNISDADGNGHRDMGDGFPSMTASTGDYDADGFLDLYVGNYERHCDSNICGDCTPDRLWRNRGNRTFENATGASGIGAQELSLTGTCLKSGAACSSDADCAPFPTDSCKFGTCARGSNWIDYDSDGDLDIFVSNYRLDPNLLWENQGDGTFTNVSFAKNCDGDEDGGAWGHVLGSDWADYDNDGDFDLYTANLTHNWGFVALQHDISQLLRSSGAPDFIFDDLRASSGMRPFDVNQQADWAETSPAWADYDNDGHVDIYVTHIYETSAMNYSTLYRNDGDGSFSETTRAHGADLGVFHDYSATWADFDRDGDLDLLTYGAACPQGCASMARLYRNDGGHANAWLHLQPRGQVAAPGTGTNRQGIGVRVIAREGSTVQMREVQGGFGYHVSMNSPAVEFGFGEAADGTLDELEVRWTTGASDLFANVPMRGRMLVLEFGDLHRGTAPDALAPGASPVKLFPHREATLNDGVTMFYRVAGEGIRETLFVEKNAATGEVVLSLR